MTYYKCGSIHPTQNSNVVVDTASGAIANFETPLAMPLPKARFDFKATQDLHGQSGPYPPGGGVNKFNKDTMVIDDAYINDTDGTQRENVGDKCTDYIEVLPDTNYYILTEQTVGRWGAWYDENKVFISGINNYGVKTAPSNAKYARFTIVRQGDGNPDKFGVNYPSTDTAYHPYSNICPIDGVSEINYTQCKKNLVNTALPAKGYFWGTDFPALVTALNKLPVGTYTLSNVFKIDEIPSPGTDKKTSVQHGPIKIYAGNIVVNSVSQTRDQNATKNKTYTEQTTFEITEDIKGNITRALLYCDKYNTHTGSSGRGKYSVYNIMVELGSTKTSYTTHNGINDVIQLGNTYYGGYVTQDKDGKRAFKVTHKKYVLDSTLAQNQISVGVLTGYTQVSYLPYIDEGVNSAVFICNKFEYQSSNVPHQTYKVWSSAAAPRMFFGLPTEITTKEEAIQLFTDNPTEIIAEFNEPYTIDLTDGEPIKSFPEINNIFCDTGDTSLQFRKIG